MDLILLWFCSSPSIWAITVSAGGHFATGSMSGGGLGASCWSHRGSWTIRGLPAGKIVDTYGSATIWPINLLCGSLPGRLSLSLSLPCLSLLDWGLIEVHERTWRDSQSPHNFRTGIDPPGKEEKTLKCRWSRLFELLRSFSWIHFRNGANFCGRCWCASNSFLISLVCTLPDCLAFIVVFSPAIEGWALQYHK